MTKESLCCGVHMTLTPRRSTALLAICGRFPAMAYSCHHLLSSWNTDASDGSDQQSAQSQLWFWNKSKAPTCLMRRLMQTQRCTSRGQHWFVFTLGSWRSACADMLLCAPQSSNLWTCSYDKFTWILSAARLRSKVSLVATIKPMKAGIAKFSVCGFDLYVGVHLLGGENNSERAQEWKTLY